MEGDDGWPYSGDWPADWLTRYADDPDLWLRGNKHVTSFARRKGGPLRCLRRLSPGWRMVLSLTRLSGQVNNAGFQSLWYYEPWTVPPSVEAFRLIGADRLALLLESVAAAADWSGESNASRDDCELGDDDGSQFDSLYYDLDNSLAPGGYELGALVNRYMREHSAEFKPLA